jgi:hypothetical protein
MKLDYHLYLFIVGVILLEVGGSYCANIDTMFSTFGSLDLHDLKYWVFWGLSFMGLGLAVNSILTIVTRLEKTM